MQIFSPVILCNSSCYYSSVFPLVCEVCFLWTWQRASPPPWAIPGRIWVNPTSLTWWACCYMVDVFSLHLLYYSCVQTTALCELEGQKGKKCRLYSEQAVLRNGAQLCLEGGLVKWKLIRLKGELEKDNLGTTVIHSWCTGHPQYLQVWGFFPLKKEIRTRLLIHWLTTKPWTLHWSPRYSCTLILKMEMITFNFFHV